MVVASNLLAVASNLLGLLRSCFCCFIFVFQVRGGCEHLLTFVTAGFCDGFPPGVLGPVVSRLSDATVEAEASVGHFL